MLQTFLVSSDNQEIKSLFEVLHSISSHESNCHSILLQPSLSPKFLGLAMYPKQISQGWLHMFFSSILIFEVILSITSLINIFKCILFFRSIIFEVIFFVTSLVNISFFTTFINVIFGIPLPFFRSRNMNQLVVPHGCINHSHVNMTKTL